MLIISKTNQTDTNIVKKTNTTHIVYNVLYYLQDNCLFIHSWNRTDTDGDGFGDICDNCVTVSNSDQIDTDLDGDGDICDDDDDNDGNY